MYQVFELACLVLRAQVQFADGIANTVAPVSRTVRVTCVRRAGHPDTHELCADRRCGKTQACIATASASERSGWECLPRSLILLVHRVAVSDPVLNLEVPRIRRGPLNTNRTNVFLFIQRDHYPLRMQ